MDERDVWRAAKVLIDKHGADAATHAAMKADDFLECGDVDGAAVWRRIVRAIGELSSSQPADGQTVN